MDSPLISPKEIRGEVTNWLSGYDINKRVNTSHKFDLGDVTILTTEPNYHKRTFLEAAYIATTPNNMNKQTDFKYINAGYKGLLRSFKTRYDTQQDEWDPYVLSVDNRIYGRLSD